MTLFEHQPHPHIEQRRETGPVRVADQHAGGFNARLAVAITSRVGTMTTAYLFAALALVSLPGAIASGNTVVIVAWVAQTFLQLTLLPVIIVGQNTQAAAADKRAEATYRDAEAILHEALEIHAHLEAQDAVLKDLHEDLNKRIGG